MLPSDAAVWLRQERARIAAHTFVTTLDAAGVPSILVKGVVLARQLYADVAERPTSDVDVLVRPRDFPRVVAIARGEGWVRVWDSKVLGVVNLGVGGTFCDVSAFVGPLGTCALGVADLLARAERTDEGLGFPHARPELHDHALLMAIDTFKDKLARPKAHAREDLIRLATQPAFRPELLVARAKEAKLATMLALVSEWVLAGRHVAPWARVRDLLGPLGRRRFVARYRAVTPESMDASPASAALVARMVSDSRWRQLAAPMLGIAGYVVYLGARPRVSAPTTARPATTPRTR